MNIRIKDSNYAASGALVDIDGLMIAFGLAIAIGYVRHVFWTIALLMADGGITTKQVILAMFCFVPPLGAAHGWYVMLFG